MKRISLLLSFVMSALFYGQFSVNIVFDKPLNGEVILYKLDGSKYIIINSVKSSSKLNFHVSESYIGMMKLYWPESNQTLNFISENKNVQMKVNVVNNKIDDVLFLDSSNKAMKEVMDRQNKIEFILPALQQIKPYYSKTDEFYKNIDKEISRLEQNINYSKLDYPFVHYYHSNYRRYLVDSDEKPVTKDMILSFVSSSNEMLETSSLLRPLLINYLNQSREDIDSSVDNLINALQEETPRGQTVLSEFIDLFSAYGMSDYAEKYLQRAKGLKCTLNDRLANTLNSHKNTELGAVFQNYTFTNGVKNTNYKTLYDIKSDKKIVVFWSSECSHCKKDLPLLLENYNKLKSLNIEVIALSVDSNKDSYENTIKAFPWINDSELRGWDSTFTDTYNINGTPTYFILDKNNKILAKPNGVINVLNFLKVK